MEPGRRRDRFADQPAGRWELNVGAHAVGTPGRGAEAGGHPLGEPALHTAGRDRDELRGEGVGREVEQKPAECVEQGVGAFGSMDVEQRREFS